MNKFIISIDFDDTIVKCNYPKIGKILKGAKKYLKKLKKDGHKIIINTCRGELHCELIKNFFKKHKIKIDAINENVPELVALYGETRKLGCHINIDDKNLLCQYFGMPSWKKIYYMIKDLYKSRSKKIIKK